MRVGSYARYSSDNQRDTSVEDQLNNGDKRAEREGWPTPLRFSDREVSASIPTHLRPGGRLLMEAVRTGEIDVLIIEALDRCWRDIVDQEQVIREIESLGIRIIGLFDGYDSEREGRELQRVIIGGVNQQYLRDLAKKTHRGLAGQVDRGLSAGGLAYGYRSVVIGLDAKGNPLGSRLEIDQEKAAVVRWIYEQYADGRGMPTIAYDLNARRVPSPRGGTWAVSGLYGSPAKGTGILSNELYTGRYTWNRSKWVKDSRGVRKRIERPRSEWKTSDRPELRIVPDDLWLAVRARLATPTREAGSRGRGKRPTTLLGGLMRCGICGGPVTATTRDSYGCSVAKNRGTSVCAGLSVYREVVETRLMAYLRETLLAPAAVAKLQKLVRDHLRQQVRTAESTRHASGERRQELTREIVNLTAAVAAMGLSMALADRLRAAEAELSALNAPVPDHGAVLRAIPDVMARYRRMLADLPGTLKREPERARKAIADMLGPVRLVADDGGLWAVMDSSPGLLMVAGLEIPKNGSGGSIAKVATTTRIRLR